MLVGQLPQYALSKRYNGYMRSSLFILFILIGVCIDALQLGLAWGFTMMGMALGTIPVIGALTGSITMVFGVGMAIIVDFCISATFGVGLITLMSLSGVEGMGKMFLALFVEVIPGCNFLPTWTGMTIYYAVRESREGRVAASTAVGAIAGPVATSELQKISQPTPTLQTGTGAQDISQTQGEAYTTEEPRGARAQQTKMALHNIEGVRSPAQLRGDVALHADNTLAVQPA